MTKTELYHKYYLEEIERRPRVTVAVPLLLYEDLEALAQVMGISKPAVMRQALQEYIDRESRRYLRRQAITATEGPKRPSDDA